jgi:hypothetical protein
VDNVASAANCMVAERYFRYTCDRGMWRYGITVIASVAEPHHFYAAPAPGKNFDAAPALAPTLPYGKAKF